MPLPSALPSHLSTPWQSRIETDAFGTGSALSSLVTQTREASRPHLKWAARFVTRADVCTYAGLCSPRRDAPRMALSSSTMYTPEFLRGMPSLEGLCAAGFRHREVLDRCSHIGQI